MRSTSGMTLAGILVILSAAILLLALLIPLRSFSERHERLLECRGRLQALHRAQADDRAATASPPLGAAYWARLAAPPLSLVDAATLRCPLHSLERPCDYRGPARPPAGLPAAAALGSDDSINHDVHGRMGGNVLRKSGDVVTAPADGDLWRTTVQRETRF